jgi:hypothetical protein
MDPVTVSVMFVLFMVAIYVNYRRGYREGVHGGHQFGVYETVSWLVEKGYLSGTHTVTGKSVSVKELTNKVLAELDERRPELQYEDLK